MDLTYSRIINNELLNKDPDVVPEQSPLSILDIKSAVCMEKNGNNTKHTEYTKHISRTMNFVRNGESVT